MFFYLILFLISFYSLDANYNDKTIKAYEKQFQVYVDTVTHVVGGLHKEWIDTALLETNKNSSIFEIGSGFGRDAGYIKSCGYQIQTSDVAQGFIEKLKMAGFKSIEFNVLKDDFSEKYDMVFASSVLLHFDKLDLHKVLLKIKHALSESGIFTFSLKLGEGEEWFVGDIKSPRYYRFWQPESIKQLVLSLGFQVLYLKKCNKTRKVFVICKKVQNAYSK
jgi:predicted TPR repeat methyltransferase